MYVLVLSDDRRITCAFRASDGVKYNTDNIVDSLPSGDITDYLWENNEYVFAPKPKLTELPLVTEPTVEEKVSALFDFLGLTVTNTDANGVFKVVKLNPSSGDYTNPIQWEPGMAITETLWYYDSDKQLPHEAIKAGVPTDFYDKAYFDFVEV